MAVETTSQLTQLRDFLGSIASFKGDLSNITAPPFILAQKSATEFPASWCSHQPLFLAQGASPDPAVRALAVLKNFLASLKTQTYTGSSEKEGAKKPLNAFLGELFIAEFANEEGGDGDEGSGSVAGGEEERTMLISEQVSHHPPVTACYLYNKKHGISAEGYVAQETSYSASRGVTVRQVGHAVIRIEEYGEQHLMTLPTLGVKGLFSGTPYPELSGICYITSTSGYTSKIEFEGKTLMGLRGVKNTVNAKVYHIDDPDNSVYEVSGHWNNSFSVRDVKADKEVEVIDVEKEPLTPMIVKPVEQQDPWETRKAWAKVMDAIARGNTKGVSENKGAIEQAQRALRKEEQEKGGEWQRVFYRRDKPDETRLKLLKQAQGELNEDRTGGFWGFVGLEEADRRLREPYHPGLVPTGHVQPS